MNALLVEDEPLAATILEDYVAQVPWLHYVGRCGTAMQALEALRQQPVDVLFLDIHLPGLKGLDLLRSLTRPPQTILTTAYEQFALESYELNAVDYLLKPIDFDRFLRAIAKLRRPHANPEVGATRAFHFFNVNKKMVRVWLDEIAVVESLREYVRLYLVDGSTLVTKGALTALESLLHDRHVVRPHRSFLIALPHVTAFTATEIYAGEHCVPIGRQYREEVQERLDAWAK
jgi:DNA-binding LytR/AlgR family response regulator